MLNNEEQYLSCHSNESNNKFYLPLLTGCNYSIGCNSFEENCFGCFTNINYGKDIYETT